MSFTDPEAGGTQPDPGQGAGGTTDAPYAEYLNRIPDEVRGQVEPVFRDWDANTTRRFQEASEFRRSWEPYEQLGVKQLTPEEVQWLMQFRGALENPQAIKEWYASYAQANGIDTPPAPQAPADEFGSYEDPNAAVLESVLRTQLGPVQARLDAFAAWQEQQEASARLAEAQRFVDSQIAELKAKHPDEFNEAAVEKLVAQYIDTDPRNAVARAFADWQSIRAQVEKSALQSKVDQPAPPEGGGLADGAPQEIKTLADAAVIARERLRQARMG